MQVDDFVTDFFRFIWVEVEAPSIPNENVGMYVELTFVCSLQRLRFSRLGSTLALPFFIYVQFQGPATFAARFLWLRTIFVFKDAAGFIDNMEDDDVDVDDDGDDNDDVDDDDDGKKDVYKNDIENITHEPKRQKVEHNCES